VLDPQPVGKLQLRRLRGFTLIELAVTIAVVALLAAVALPYLGGTISNSRTRTVVAKFTQDFAWLRNAAGTGTHTVTLTLNADCSWAGTVDGNADGSRSFSVAQVRQSTPGMNCSGQGGTNLPLTLTFNSQGFVAPSANFVFAASAGQRWPMQVLGSGTLVITTGSS
jgi:prepilin-type N-terminal cleavage/methylation domain-containing protein